MEKKYLRWIGIAAAVLTGLMLIYTIIAALTGGKQQANLPPVAATEQVGGVPQSDDQKAEQLFPAQLAGMDRVEVVSGQKAVDSVSKMHGTSIRAVEAYVVTYQGPGKDQILLWVTVAKDEADGKALFTAMDQKMPTTQYFKNYKTLALDGQEYKFVTSQDGMQHYYLSLIHI